VHSLLLPSSQDLICKNMMCEHVGSSCACKLSLVLERLPQLQEMDLSNNKLRFLPESTFQLTHLMHLNLARNHLTTLSPSVQQLTNLAVLDLRDNRITSLPEDALLMLPNLKQIRVAGNPQEIIEAVQSEKLRAIITTNTTAEE
jgi:Leucine-rich repeat (LRR) protein